MLAMASHVLEISMEAKVSIHPNASMPSALIFQDG